jgi:hypothetical protein
MAKFPENFHIEVLQGAERLGPTKVRKTLAHRAAWLSGKVEYAMKLRASGLPGPDPHGPMFDDLAATVEAMEAYDREQERKVRKEP